MIQLSADICDLCGSVCLEGGALVGYVDPKELNTPHEVTFADLLTDSPDPHDGPCQLVEGWLVSKRRKEIRLRQRRKATA